MVAVVGAGGEAGHFGQWQWEHHGNGSPILIASNTHTDNIRQGSTREC